MRTLFKPSGLTVFPLHADRHSDCLVARLLAEEPARRHLGFPEGFEAGIAHRLDVYTSGAVLCADDPAELALLREAFSSGVLRKTYRFIAAQDVPWDSRICERSLAHSKKSRKRMVVERGPNTPHRGRWYPASSTFRRLEGPLWEVVIHTGVMHQIRVHAAFLGLPLLGDVLYGGGEGDPGFKLHHVGLVGPGIHTEPVPLPAWAQEGSRSSTVTGA